LTPCPKCNTPFDQKEIAIGNITMQYPYECTKCALETTKRLEDEAKATQDAEEASRVDLWIKNAGIPLRYKNLTSFSPKNKTQSISWDFRRNLIFFGGTGAGKTHIACFIAIAGIKHYRKTARYTTHAEMIRRIKGTWSSKSISEESVINDLIGCDVLIIDEIDKQEYTQYLFQIMDGRYNAMLPTIIIGNATIDAIKSILGDAIVSRLREQGVSARAFEAVDYRDKKE